jgi:hypothetical protein
MPAITNHPVTKKLGPDESGYFPDGSHIVRVERLPWTPFGFLDLHGSDEVAQFKLLSVLWQYDFFSFLLKVPAYERIGHHHHIGEAHGYVLSGGFTYPEYADVRAGDYVGEASNNTHEAIDATDHVNFSFIFGGICGVHPDGSLDMDHYIGCLEAYQMAAANGAADHIEPPPPGWRSSYRPA